MRREVWVARNVFLPNRKGRKQSRKITRILRKLIKALTEHQETP
jgi:hypothetical protein